jgi:hypothetical protein
LFTIRGPENRISYFSITLTPGAGAWLYDTLFFNLDGSANNLGSNYVTNIAVRWSVDGFTTTLGTCTQTINIGQNSISGYSIATLPSYGWQTGPVEFRFFFYDNQNESMFTYTAMDSITLTATPEPSTWAMLATGLASLLAVRRRR